MGGFLVFVVVAAIGYLAWRGARRRYEDARAALKRRQAGDRRAVTLEKDPETGVYRQKERGP